MKRFLKSLDGADWFILGFAALLILLFELTKPVPVFSPIIAWAKHYANAPKAVQTEPAKTPEPVDGPIFTVQNPEISCPKPGADGSDLVMISGKVSVVRHPAPDGIKADIAKLLGKIVENGYFGALAMDEFGNFGRTWRYASRDEASRAALRMCDAEGDGRCRVVAEAVPSNPAKINACAWTVTPYQAGIYAKHRASKAKAAVFVMNRAGHAGFASHEKLNSAANTALRACIAAAEANQDGIDSPCYVVANKSADQFEQLLFRQKSESNYALKPVVAKPVAKPAPVKKTARVPTGRAVGAPTEFAPERFEADTAIMQPFRQAYGGAIAALENWKATPEYFGAFAATKSGDRFKAVKGYARLDIAVRKALAGCGDETCQIVAKMVPSDATGPISNHSVTLTYWQQQTLRRVELMKGPRAFAYANDGASALAVGDTVESAMEQAMQFCRERLRPESPFDPALRCQIGLVLR